MKKISLICSAIAAVCALLAYSIPNKVDDTQNDLIYSCFLAIMFLLMNISYEIRDKKDSK